MTAAAPVDRDHPDILPDPLPVDPLPGEDPCIRERVVVSPALGEFVPVPPRGPTALDDGMVHAGALIGWVGGTEVRCPFTGRFMGLLAIPGRRVTVGEPLAWVRT